MSVGSCSGEDGACPHPVEKAGLCAGHRARKKIGNSKKSLAEPVAARLIPRGFDVRRSPQAQREESSLKGWAKFNPLEQLLRVAASVRDELDTATDAEWQKGRERFRDALRRRDWVYIPALLRRQKWDPDPKVNDLVKTILERWLAGWGDKAKHAAPKRKHSHQKHPPQKFGNRSK